MLGYMPVNGGLSAASFVVTWWANV